jgi:hypothetical protein
MAKFKVELGVVRVYEMIVTATDVDDAEKKAKENFSTKVAERIEEPEINVYDVRFVSETADRQ